MSPEFEARAQVTTIPGVSRAPSGLPKAFRSRIFALSSLVVVALCAPRRAHAQPSALGHLGPALPAIRYAANESGGRITITHAMADSSAIESIRLRLLEMAAAIRRGDFRPVAVIRADLPAVRVLSSKSQSIRCTFRPTARGGELVLLSDDDEVVTAIHQLLAAEPPPIRL